MFYFRSHLNSINLFKTSDTAASNEIAAVWVVTSDNIERWPTNSDMEKDLGCTMGNCGPFHGALEDNPHKPHIILLVTHMRKVG
jgi:hypothetical protein